MNEGKVPHPTQPENYPEGIPPGEAQAIKDLRRENPDLAQNPAHDFVMDRGGTLREKKD